jgi:hypothetical protein
VAKVRSRLKPLFKAIHKAIVTAKMRWLRSELTFSGARENWSPRTDADAARFPQRPLILGDKWDFKVTPPESMGARVSDCDLRSYFHGAP